MDDGGAALTLSNVATEGEGLPERDPTLPGKAALNDGAPQDQDIDPGIAPIGGRVLRHGERSAGCRRCHGWIQGTRPASNSAMILSAIS
jgi:hypothetical protein